MSFTSLLDGFKVFSVRFLLVSFLPTLSLIAVILILILSGAPGPHPQIVQALTRLHEFTFVDYMLLLLACAVGGVILHPLQFSLIRFLEGYWGASRLAIRLALLASGRYERKYYRWDEGRQGDYPKLTDETRERVVDTYVSARSSLPAPDRMMPTRLGNALRVAEDFAGERYGLSTVAIIPRLIPQLSPEVADRLADSRLQMDVAVRFCLVWLLATCFTFAMLINNRVWLWIPAGMYALAWLSYRASCAAAEGYGLMLSVAIDLHRFDLLEALHQPLPRSYREEVKRNQILSRILTGYYRTTADPKELPSIGYRHPEKAPDSLNATPKESSQAPP